MRDGNNVQVSQTIRGDAVITLPLGDLTLLLEMLEIVEEYVTDQSISMAPDLREAMGGLGTDMEAAIRAFRTA